tara:strand:+ start:598 stop:831 length:234 start_codon:yes stop_codon:yes gene_type:complete
MSDDWLSKRREFISKPLTKAVRERAAAEYRSLRAMDPASARALYIMLRDVTRDLLNDSIKLHGRRDQFVHPMPARVQ